MSIYCSAQTYRATMDSPAEYCINEVQSEGDVCDVHDADARMDEDYDRYLDAKAEREADPDYYTDYGDGF